MKVAIIGTHQPSQIIKGLISQHYNFWIEQRLGETIDVVAFVDFQTQGGGVVDNTVILNFAQFATLYHKKLIDKIILPREQPAEIYCWHIQVMSYLKQLGVKIEDIYMAHRLDDKIDVINLFEPYQYAKFLPYLEFIIADHCNLNCKACANYAGLVKKPHFTDLKKFTQDFEQLHKFIDDIETIRILGGEPLLNPEVNEYMRLTRQLYPNAVIYLVTNALLLSKMSEEFFNTVRETDTIIFISLYPPMTKKIDSVKNMLQKNGIKSRIMPPISKFFMDQTLEPHDKPAEMFFKCSASQCNNIYDGKVAACSKPFLTKYFNACFDKNLPNDGILDLYEPNITTKKIKDHLITPFERCRYCIDKRTVDWKTISHPDTLSDWIVGE